MSGEALSRSAPVIKTKAMLPSSCRPATACRPLRPASMHVGGSQVQPLLESYYQKLKERHGRELSLDIRRLRCNTIPLLIQFAEVRVRLLILEAQGAQALRITRGLGLREFGGKLRQEYFGRADLRLD